MTLLLLVKNKNKSGIILMMINESVETENTQELYHKKANASSILNGLDDFKHGLDDFI